MTRQPGPSLLALLIPVLLERGDAFTELRGRVSGFPQEGGEGGGGEVGRGTRHRRREGDVGDLPVRPHKNTKTCDISRHKPTTVTFSDFSDLHTRRIAVDEGNRTARPSLTKQIEGGEYHGKKVLVPRRNKNCLCDQT